MNIDNERMFGKPTSSARRSTGAGGFDDELRAAFDRARGTTPAEAPDTPPAAPAAGGFDQGARGGGGPRGAQSADDVIRAAVDHIRTHSGTTRDL